MSSTTRAGVLLALILGTLAPCVRAQTARERFLGTWRLVSIQGDTAVVRDRGTHPTGYIYYDATGHMGVNIQPDRHRPAWSVGTLTPEVAYEAVRGYVAYFGTWDVDEKAGTVTHHREGALNFDTVDYVRRFTFEGKDRLILAPVERPGFSLTWERVR